MWAQVGEAVLDLLRGELGHVHASDARHEPSPRHRHISTRLTVVIDSGNESRELT
jgi:hypothetical protein